MQCSLAVGSEDKPREPSLSDRGYGRVSRSASGPWPFGEALCRHTARGYPGLPVLWPWPTSLMDSSGGIKSDPLPSEAQMELKVLKSLLLLVLGMGHSTLRGPSH